MEFGSTFLTQPFDELASTAAGSWGGNRINIGLTGGPYSFAGLSDRQRRWAEQRFAGYCADPDTASPAVEIGLRRLPADRFRTFDIRGWEYTFDRDYRPDCTRLAGLDFAARIDFRPRLSGILWTSQESPAGFPGVFENFFRVILGYRLSRLGGTLLHSAAIARDARAFVLVGRSGAGKSTSARLALEAGWEVLSDDMNALVRDGAGWAVEKIPFTGDLGRTPTRRRRYALTGVYWLEKAQRPGIRPLSPAELIARLLACAPILNDDPFHSGQLLDTLADLVRTHGRGALRFAREAGFVRLLDPIAALDGAQSAGVAVDP